MLTYKIEVKASNMSAAKMGKFGHPGRIWVRGYNEQGERVEQHSIGFVDLRYSGPRSNYARVYAEAQALCDKLTSFQRAQREDRVDFEWPDGSCGWVTADPAEEIDVCEFFSRRGAKVWLNEQPYNF